MTPTKSDWLAAWSTFATAVVAALALTVAVIQVRTSNEAQREATAQDTYKEYLKLAIENPELSDGLETLPTDQKLRTKYGWFVSYFLHSAEHVSLIYPNDPEWRAAISNQVCFHRAFLRGDDYQTNLQFHYNEQFRNLVKEALGKCKP